MIFLSFTLKEERLLAFYDWISYIYSFETVNILCRRGKFTFKERSQIWIDTDRS
jgi:hypothetical protein